MNAGTDQNGTLFRGHYEEWRTKRINKIIEILGNDFFEGKELLELGCGYGDIGLYFRNLKADVTFTDARVEHLEHVKKHSPNSKTYQLDQDTEWNLGTSFDLIIHTGVLYHLSNWRQDLQCTLNHSDKIILETVVENHPSDTFEREIREKDAWDQAFNLSSVRPSAACLEKFLTDIGVKFTRFDDSDLNVPAHRYDWVVGEKDKNRKYAYRRFYLLEKIK